MDCSNHNMVLTLFLAGNVFFMVSTFLALGSVKKYMSAISQAVVAFDAIVKKEELAREKSRWS